MVPGQPANSPHQLPPMLQAAHMIPFTHQSTPDFTRSVVYPARFTFQSFSHPWFCSPAYHPLSTLPANLLIHQSVLHHPRHL
ncbi:hypothetical protein DPEC_G00140170 [Dallia pectoralis]|uniref:Uncharacterized protein n=1 Tax=Dallia pectoralis TaxID=75939 RepID=A0ACC2GMY1_DALPE|nr:hypothetical protein DPEC_G00140170 [Dallia pectoralis]